jgi:hypothetical protein
MAKRTWLPPESVAARFYIWNRMAAKRTRIPIGGIGIRLAPLGRRETPSRLRSLANLFLASYAFAWVVMVLAMRLPTLPAAASEALENLLLPATRACYIDHIGATLQPPTGRKSVRGSGL